MAARARDQRDSPRKIKELLEGRLGFHVASHSLPSMFIDRTQYFQVHPQRLNSLLQTARGRAKSLHGIQKMFSLTDEQGIALEFGRSLHLPGARRISLPHPAMLMRFKTHCPAFAN